MSDRVRHLKPPNAEVGQHFRLGHTAYKQFADWAAARPPLPAMQAPGSKAAGTGDSA